MATVGVKGLRSSIISTGSSQSESINRCGFVVNNVGPTYSVRRRVTTNYPRQSLETSLTHRTHITWSLTHSPRRKLIIVALFSE